MSAPVVLQAHGIDIRYPGQARPVLAGFDLGVRAGEVVAVLGPSGVGKSSLLRVLAGLQPASAGQVTVDGEPLRGAHPAVAVAFQSPALLPWLTLEQNVAFGLDFASQPPRERAERDRRVAAAIAEVGLSHARLRYPAELSGGMAQRAALARCLARCLARGPRVLLLDEPFGALDEATRADMQQLLVRLAAHHATAAVLITHDIDEALLVADRILLLGDAPARVLGEWTPALPHPRDELIAELGALRVDILQTLHRARQAHARAV